MGLYSAPYPHGLAEDPRSRMAAETSESLSQFHAELAKIELPT